MTNAPSNAAVDLALEVLYRYLGAALQAPGAGEDGPDIAGDPASQRLACAAADFLRREFAELPIPLGFGELPVEELSLQAAVNFLPPTRSDRCREFVRVFGLSACRECPPYETEYHKAEEVFFRSQQMADVAGFYQAFGLAPGGRSRERPDHLALELEFVACLLMKQRLAQQAARSDAPCEQAEVCRDAREKFVRDHLSWWVPSFSLALRRKAERGFYFEIGRVLGALMPLERRRLGIAPPLLPLEASFIEAPDECSGCLVTLGT